MDLKKVGIVIGREYSTRVQKKSFILITLLTPLLMGLLIVLPVLITLWGGNENQTVRIIDHSGFVAPYFENSSHVTYETAQEGETMDAIRAAFDELGIYAAVEISEADKAGNVKVDTYSKEPLNMDIKSAIRRYVGKAVEDNKLSKYDLGNLDEIMADVKTDIEVNAMTLTGDGEAKKDSVEIYMVLAYLMSFLIYMFIFLFGGMVMRSVIDEKSSRVVEVIVSSVKSTELMMGKIIGVALVALTQFVIWVALTLAIVVGVSTFVMPKLAEDAGVAQAVQMAATTGVHPDTIDAIAEAAAAQAEESDSQWILDTINQVKGLPWAYMLGCFLIYFLLGYLLYASMFAAVGAAVDNEADTSQLQLPITIPLILGLFIMLHTFEHPSSQLSFWASIIPFTSPMVMLARIPFGVVPFWQLALSIGLLIITFIGIAYLSAKIYKAGILMYGKKSTWKDLWKWMKQKN
ncbi:MAG: ABC transporter permease [Bacteroidales bacterium]|nr:ABC transporter permease [Bacteroidales bacterium]